MERAADAVAGPVLDRGEPERGEFLLSMTSGNAGCSLRSIPQPRCLIQRGRMRTQSESPVRARYIEQVAARRPSQSVGQESLQAVFGNGSELVFRHPLAKPPGALSKVIDGGCHLGIFGT